MYIKKLIINENEKNIVDISLNKGLNTIEKRDCVLDVILCVLGKKCNTPLNKDYSFYAEIFMEETYFLNGNKPKFEIFWKLSVSKENGEDNCIAEYFQKLQTNPEMENLSYFHQFKKQKYPHRFEHYKDILKYYPNGEFGRLTNGYGSTRSFRGFITQYIKYFKPIKLRDNRNLFLNLLPNGRFTVTDFENKEPPVLSNSENLLYHYYSFLTLADFWARAERIRNLNYENQPLIISGFLEFLDDSINLSQVMGYADKIGRQVIMFVPKIGQNHNYTLYQKE